MNGDLVVLSYFKAFRCCKGCGETTILFPVHRTDTDEVRDRCKGCAEKIAAEAGLEVFVKSTWPRLREVWAKNRLPAEPAALAAGRLRKRADDQDQSSVADSGQSARTPVPTSSERR